MKPSVGRIVHYVSHGTPPRDDGSQAYTSECRAAIVTEARPLTVDDAAQAEIEGWPAAQRFDVSLCVLNPTGQFFNRNVPYDSGAGQPGHPDCPNNATHGSPFRYCACGWTEPTKRGGTWHWPEREDG